MRSKKEVQAKLKEARKDIKVAKKETKKIGITPFRIRNLESINKPKPLKIGLIEEVAIIKRIRRKKRTQSEFKPDSGYIAKSVKAFKKKGGIVTDQNTPATTDKECSLGIKDANPAYDFTTKFGQTWGTKLW